MAARPKDDPRIAFMMRALNASSHAYKLAGLLCWRYGDNKRGLIFPSQETLARDLGVMERTVRRIIQELIPIGLRVKIRRGPRTVNKLSFYSFDGPIIPDTRNLNSDQNSGHEEPKLEDNSGHLTPEFRTFGTNNSGHQTPPTQKNYPTGGPNRESAQARATLTEPAFDSNLEMKNGEILPPENQGGRRQGKPTPLPPEWQPSDEDWGYASQQCGLTAEHIDAELTNFRNWYAEKGTRSCDWSASWRRFVGNSRQNRSKQRRSNSDIARDLAAEAYAIEQAMVAAGIDPADRAAYLRFKAEFNARVQQ